MPTSSGLSRQVSRASKTISSPTGAARLPRWSMTRRVARTLVLLRAMWPIPAISSSREQWATRTSAWWALVVDIQATTTFTAASAAFTLLLAGTRRRSASSPGTTCTESGRTSTTTCCHCWMPAALTSGPRRRARHRCTTIMCKTRRPSQSAAMGPVPAGAWSAWRCAALCTRIAGAVLTSSASPSKQAPFSTLVSALASMQLARMWAPRSFQLSRRATSPLPQAAPRALPSPPQPRPLSRRRVPHPPAPQQSLQQCWKQTNLRRRRVRL
mmetsp:Transcript_73647/g.172808  ORF Transcript_73647/g.172808 Transcript_73647/m.172808 type:complete len:270 (+) Transcript_73647:325-1134(+)